MASADDRFDLGPRFKALTHSPLFWAVAALWLLLLTVESARPCFFLHDDNADQFIGAFVHDFRVLTETGRLAEVDYFQRGGEPFVEQGQTAVLYPPVYLGVFFAQEFSGDVRWSLEWIAAINLTIGLVGFHFWLRQGGIVPWQATLGGLAWVLNPFVLIVGQSWIFLTHVAAWLPWLFWALDRMLARPSGASAFFLGASASLLLVQGYVQYFAYAVLFLLLYAVFQFATRREARRSIVVYYLFVSVLIFVILSLPLLLPMNYVVGISAMRSDPLPMDSALYYSTRPDQIFTAQVCDFDRWLAFGVSASALYCTALLLTPLMIYRIFSSDAEMRLRLMILLALGLLAAAFSERWHWLLSELPIYDRFRWPFKVFVFVDFFMISALAWTASSWTQPVTSRPWWGKRAAVMCLGLVVLGNLDISLGYHDQDCFSLTDLPAGRGPLLPGMDARLGRVIAFSDNLPDEAAFYYYTRAYATYFAFPSIGGYNPLVRQDTISYGFDLDYPNICSDPVTPEFQKRLEAKSVRYWIVDPLCYQYPQVKSLSGLKVLEAKPDRVIFEDTRAAPLVYSETSPSVPCAMSYSGNSILIPLVGVASPVLVSVCPTDGWWYRIGDGPWQKPVDKNDRLVIPFVTPNPRLENPPDALLEVTYFDPRFWLAVKWSFGLLLPLVLMLVAGRRFFVKS